MRLLVLWLVLFVCAVEARAEPWVARWINPESSPSAATILEIDLVEDNAGPLAALLETPCEPGQTCSTPFDLPPGDWSVVARSGVFSRSDLSNVLEISIEPALPLPPPPVACSDEPMSVRADFNGDGDVTTLDFRFFLQAFLE